MAIKKKMTLFDIVNVLFMLFIIFITLYPIYYVVIASFSDPGALSRTTGVLWLPLKPYTTEAYEMVLGDEMILIGFKNTLFVLVVGLIVNISMTVVGGYFLSLKGLMVQTPIVMMIIFTMYFSGGLVPGYLNVKDLGLLNSLWALILPGAISTTNLIIMKSAFCAMPDSLVESARLDGASHLQILIKIMVPLSKATVAVLVLYYGVSHWNAWFNASIYLRDTELYPLQLIMRNILNSSVGAMAQDVAADEFSQYVELIKYALIVVTTAPILVLYPFLQKYFVKGVMIGAIKG